MILLKRKVNRKRDRVIKHFKDWWSAAIWAGEYLKSDHDSYYFEKASRMEVVYYKLKNIFK